MKTYTILIGNSDDKLTQKQWAEFIGNLNFWIKKFCDEIHFAASSSGELPWQNYSITFECEDSKIIWIKENLIELKKQYNQQSIAIIEGITYFI